MNIYDVSMEIYSEMEVYKKRPEKRPVISLISEIEKNGSNESEISMNLHTGTHIDASYHMKKNGQTIENIPLKRLITQCRVLDMKKLAKITAKDLSHHQIEKGDFILLKTDNSWLGKERLDFVYLEQSGAEYLAKNGVIGVGIDALGIERDQKNHRTHNILMDNDIIIIEGLSLKEVPEGKYVMIALPLKIKGADGAPARVVLLDQNPFAKASAEID